jgi:acyl-CoA reductase-like NAD-dependent aldehyde dehydrogenase
MQTMETISVIDKYSGEEIGTVPNASKTDVERAIASAAKAFPAYADLPAHQRAKILARASDRLAKYQEDIATIICREAGKAWKFSMLEVARAIETFQFAAEEAKRIHGETGLPEGVFNLIFGGGATVGDWLVTDPRVAKITFTGSPPVGERIMSRAGLKEVTLELGNNSGTLIEEDADIDRAVPRCVVSSFANSGQICISLQRLYLHEAIADEFTKKFIAATAKLKIGNPLDKDCDVGPMITESEAERAEVWMNEAVAQGAKVLIGGKRKGRMLWPTVMTDVEPDMKVMCQETFAPQVSLVRYRSFEEGLEMLADSPYGLQAGIYTRDIKKAFQAIKRVDVGGMMVNDTSIFRVDQMPYGGNKMSGIGREGVRFAIEEMTNIRMVCFNLA